MVDDGGKVAAGGVIAEIAGKTRALLTGERIALNFLGRLSGIATLTASYRRGGRGHAAPASPARARRRRACAPSRNTR